MTLLHVCWCDFFCTPTPAHVISHVWQSFGMNYSALVVCVLFSTISCLFLLIFQPILWPTHSLFALWYYNLLYGNWRLLMLISWCFSNCRNWFMFSSFCIRRTEFSLRIRARFIVFITIRVFEHCLQHLLGTLTFLQTTHLFPSTTWWSFNSRLHCAYVLRRCRRHSCRHSTWLTLGEYLVHVHKQTLSYNQNR